MLSGLAAYTGRESLAYAAAAFALLVALWPRSKRAAKGRETAAPLGPLEARIEGTGIPPRTVVPPPAQEPARPRVAPIVSTEPDQVLGAMASSVSAIVPCVATHLWLQDPPTGTLRLVAAHGEMRPEATPVSFETAWASGAVSRGESSLTSMASISDEETSTKLWRLAFAVPSGAAAGVAGIDVKSEAAPAREALENVALSYQPALSAALALHVARRETERAAHLLDSARELSRRLEPDDVVATALDSAISLSSAASASIMLPGEDGALRIVASRGLPEDVVAETRVESGEGIAGWVFGNGKPLLVEDLHPEGTSRRRDVRSAVCVPIADEDGVLGVLSVGSREYPAHFTDANMSALAALGRQVAVALRNAMAMESATDLYFSTLTALAVALETKDPYALGGTRRVADLTLALGRRAGLEEQRLHALHVAALLHDVGMTLAGAPLGATARPLTTVERGMLKAHPVVAAQVLEEIPSLSEVVPLVYHHHEWYDGHGYVAGLAGDMIPAGARLLAVADAFVAMTSDRPYRRAMSVRAAFEELDAKSGTQFDPDAVAALRDVLREQPELALPKRDG